MRIRQLVEHARRHRRRGVAAMLFGFLLPVFLGFAAVSVDTAILATARSQLSTAADASALAGAQALADEFRVRGATDLTTEINTANTQAAAFAASNRVLGQGVTLVPNLTNNAAGDVVVGYLNPNAPTSSLVTVAGSSSLFNAVQVRAARSADRGGTVPTFFGGLMGFRGSSISVQSTAVAQNYSISGYKSVGANVNANLLPIVLDTSTYDLMIAKQTTDSYTYNPVTKAVSSGADGV